MTGSTGGVKVNDASATSSLVAKKPATVTVHLVKSAMMIPQTFTEFEVLKIAMMDAGEKVLLGGNAEGTFVRTHDATKIEV